MDLRPCPHCETRVVPGRDGECPACRKNVNEPSVPAVEPAVKPPAHVSASTATMLDASSLVTIRTFPFLPAAEMARWALEEAGVPAVLADAELVSMNWMLGNAVGYIKLQVTSDQAEVALSVLEDMDIARENREDDDDDDDDDIDDKDDDDLAGEHEPDHAASALSTMRGMKNGALWIILAPLILGIGLAAVGGFVAFVRRLSGP